ncbi:MAG: indole-3-glycerol phosphate synthase TrpC [Cyclobacteriaceae bacterium]|nr:indole-3-glycerol phosphate synthase TrpC [Cyclobacteriaceae bacterium]
MNILQNIVQKKREIVAERRELIPVKLLEKSIFFPSQTVSLKKYLLRPDKSGIIAEFKRKSPSKGLINKNATVEKTSIGYMQAGASALSILTDTDFFGGKNEDLTTARKFNFCPILRKDFILEEYQIIEAKSIGADAILLIAAILDPDKARSLSAFAHSLGMEVLLEVHSASELQKFLDTDPDLIGVNNRDLSTFQTKVQTSLDLASLIPDEMVKVSESGIDDPLKIIQLKQAGYKGFLIGEYFMQHGRPEGACQEFIRKLKLLNTDQPVSVNHKMTS